MTKIFAAIVLLFIYLVFSQADRLVQGHLAVHDPNASEKRFDYVGGGCLAEKCLLIYTAPWCPTCQRLTPVMIALAQALRQEGIPVSIIAGKDSDRDLALYAKKFPFPIYLDAEGEFFQQAELKAVPYFVVTNDMGEILEDIYGGYRSVKALRENLDI